MPVDDFLRNPYRWQPGDGLVFQGSGPGVPARAVYRFPHHWAKPGLSRLMAPYMNSLVMMEADAVPEVDEAVWEQFA